MYDTNRNESNSLQSSKVLRVCNPIRRIISNISYFAMPSVEPVSVPNVSSGRYNVDLCSRYEGRCSWQHPSSARRHKQRAERRASSFWMNSNGKRRCGEEEIDPIRRMCIDWSLRAISGNSTKIVSHTDTVFLCSNIWWLRPRENIGLRGFIKLTFRWNGILLYVCISSDGENASRVIRVNIFN